MYAGACMYNVHICKHLRNKAVAKCRIRAKTKDADPDIYFGSVFVLEKVGFRCGIKTYGPSKIEIFFNIYQSKIN